MQMEVGRALVDVAAPRRWLELFGIGLLQVLLMPFGIALFVLVTVGLATSVVSAGVAILTVTVPLLEWYTRLYRKLAGRVLGRPVPAWYAKQTQAGLFARWGTWLRDPMRWRDYLWSIIGSVAGFTISVVALSLPLVVLFYLVYPLLFALTPREVFGTFLGFIHLSDVASSFISWIVAALAAGLTWYLTPRLLMLRASIDASLLSGNRVERLERRVETLSQTRADSVDMSAAELRRIERDLHDGAQARLVSLGMSLGLAQELMESDPAEAQRLLGEARSTSTAALGDLRSVVRGIHPPLLADRGLAGAVQALALDLAVPVTLTVSLPGRPAAPIESAVYFAIAESLANVVKHAKAGRAWVTLEHEDGVLRAEVRDDGVGGARVVESGAVTTEGGSGLAGMTRRLAAFDGSVRVSSPEGGPTLITMEVPCALSSGKTTRSSATG